MRIYLLTILLLTAMGALSWGQSLDRGNFMVGSTLGFSTASSVVNEAGKETKGLSAQLVQIAPSIGYFVTDNLALGIGADFTIDRVSDPELGGKRDNSNLLFGPFGRYYVPAAENVAFFFVANFGFGNSTSERTVAGLPQGIRNNIFASGVGPGFTVYARSGLAIEAILKYNYARSRFEATTSTGKVTTTTRTNQVGLSIGLQYYFAGFKRLS